MIFANNVVKEDRHRTSFPFQESEMCCPFKGMRMGLSLEGSSV